MFSIIKTTHPKSSLWVAGNEFSCLATTQKSSGGAGIFFNTREIWEKWEN